MTRSFRSDEAGFTLVEMVVAMVASVAVLFGLSTILIGTVRQTQRTLTRVSATRQGRTAIADIEDELHSACIGGGQNPIQAGSTGVMLEFVSYYGDSPTPTPVWHVITYNATAHTLTDASWGVTSTSSAPNWAQNTTTSATNPTSNQLLTNVYQVGTAPVFQYYAYAPGSSDAGGIYWFVHDGTTPDPGTGVTPAAASQLGNISLTTALTASQAEATVEVTINLSVGPDSDSANNGQSLTVENDQVADAISLRLTTPPDEVSGTVAAGVPPGYGPCE